MARRGAVAPVIKGAAILAEEMPHAYKDVADVVETMELAGISKRVCRAGRRALLFETPRSIGAPVVPNGKSVRTGSACFRHLERLERLSDERRTGG